MPPLNLLIKPSSGNCNMRCKYCFYYDITQKRKQSSYGFMTEETIENIIKKALDYADGECTIAYQGGEPSLIGIDFFKKNIEFQKKYNYKQLKINNAIQTNGYEMNDEWAKFFVQNNFLVGLSIDGTKETHNSFRFDAHGKETFNKIMKTVALFNQEDVQYNILTVVNSRTARKIDSIYSFYKKNNFKYLQFIPCLDPLGEEGGQHDYSLIPKQYATFLKTLFDLWYRDFTSGKEIHIRQFENYIEMLLGYPPESCGMSGICSYQNVIEADGEVYPCDFYVLDQYKLGNLNSCDFQEINQNREKIKFIEESMIYDEKCKKCKYSYICRGGCKRYREPRKDGNLQLNYFCQSYYDFFEYSIDRLTSLARQFARRY